MKHPRKRRVCIITTAPISLWALHKGFFPYLIKKGYEVTTLAGPGSRMHQLVRAEGVHSVELPLLREPHLPKDILSLVSLWLFFLRNRFDVIHASTPKAMLLGMVAGLLSGHRCRVVTVRGRAYERYTGVKRRLFVLLDLIAFKIAQKVIPICKELGDQLVADGCPQDKITFIGASSNGIDTKVFCRTKQNLERGAALRAELHIPLSATVILSLGRVRREKGVNELVGAFKRLESESCRELHLVLVGPYEEADPLESNIKSEIDSNPQIHAVGSMLDTIPWYAMSDIVAFPSYREGFGNVSIEASAMEIPVVASDIMGCREGVLSNQTGLLVPAQNVNELATALLRLINNPELRKKLGKQGRHRVVSEFQPKDRWDAILKIYSELIVK